MCVEKSVSIAASCANAFETTIALAPDALIKTRGPMPGVAEWSGVSRWTQPGDNRRLRMTAGVTLIETLTSIDPPYQFSYRTTGFGGWFGTLNDHCKTQWSFEQTGTAQTHIRWCACFFARSAPASIILPFVVKPLWPGYMAAALNRLRDQIDDRA